MEKVYDYIFLDRNNKIYDMNEIVDVPSFVDEILKNGVQISDVSLSEGVELEMQSVSGNTYTLEEFLYGYDYIREMGEELKYIFSCTYDDKQFTLMAGEKSKCISLSSYDYRMELEDFFDEKRYKDRS